MMEQAVADSESFSQEDQDELLDDTGLAVQTVLNRSLFRRNVYQQVFLQGRLS